MLEKHLGVNVNCVDVVVVVVVLLLLLLSLQNQIIYEQKTSLIVFLTWGERNEDTRKMIRKEREKIVTYVFPILLIRLLQDFHRFFFL